jgi:hypothetical protein
VQTIGTGTALASLYSHLELKLITWLTRIRKICPEAGENELAKQIGRSLSFSVSIEQTFDAAVDSTMRRLPSCGASSQESSPFLPQHGKNQ